MALATATSPYGTLAPPPSRPTTTSPPRQLLRLYPDYGDVYNIAWTGDNRWLLAGTAAGLVGWNIDDEKVANSASKEYK